MIPLTVKITFNADFSIGAGHGLAGLADHAIVKTRDGLPYIPGNTIKGNLRHSCEEISRMLEIPLPLPDEPGAHCELPVARLFGTPYQHPACTFGTAYLRGTQSESFFKDYITSVESHNRIDPHTCTAMHDHFFSLEAADKQLSYEFKIDTNLTSDTVMTDEDISLLVAGILYTNRLGAKKSRGRGDCALEIINKSDEWKDKATRWIDKKIAALQPGGADEEK